VKQRIRLEIFGARMDAEYAAERWTLYRVGGDGKRSDSGLLIPSFVAPVEREQHRFDLLHEAAKPGNSAIRRQSD
jgi:hypothetical protein